MDETPDPAAAHGEHARAERHQDVEVRVRRTPRYWRFIALGAVLGAVAMWVIGVSVPPGLDAQGQRVDTSPVIGLGIVIGFVVGAGLGGLVAVIIDRALVRRGQTLVAEQTDIEEPEAPDAAVDESAADAGEAAFEPLEPAEPAADEPQERDRPSGA
ncbi:hypothetical protein [Agrococcus sp. ARC_14]|uniref:hypothetical protein n=1 Tax=Agrococcus sp. ARC_14 TaxID=2919927 RepID=UPI001F059287|nr:hypothetical protein [Agrococcus sp. ARC_14]MCH1882043.1 hypothetical protein [Agrococcus sp. ARC_14]